MDNKISVIVPVFNIESYIKRCVDSILSQTYPNIETICLNGNKSYTAFKKYFPDLLDKYTCYKMPSTSPANARYSLNKLIEEWNFIYNSQG